MFKKLTNVFCSVRIACIVLGASSFSSAYDVINLVMDDTFNLLLIETFLITS